ncbi:MAG: M56 family metallopeptidase [Bacteroidales bacterium]|nr:M56 family metallopeptidase [Bacteroidales bacterium]
MGIPGMSSAQQYNKEEIMGTWFIFMLKSMLCLTTLFLFYKVLLSKETFHTLNRYVLMGILAVSVLLPFCEIPTTEVRPIQVAFHTLEVVVTADSPIKEKTAKEVLTPTATVDYEKSLKETEYERVYPEEKASTSELNLHLFLIVCLVIYLLGAAVRMSAVARSLYLLYKTIGRATKVKHGKYTIAILPGKVSPYSWWKYIVLSEEDYKGKNDEILAHELAHLNRHHSTDVMLCELFTIFQWFNPATYLLKQELQSIHEYEADSAVISNGFNPTHYQLLLIKEAVGSSSYTLANSLNHSSLKKRITMMLRKRSNRWAQMKAFGFLPLAAILLSAFARPVVSSQTEALTTDKSTENVLNKEAGLLNLSDAIFSNSEKDSVILTKKEDEKAVPFASMDNPPVFPGGDAKLMEFVQKIVQYPKEAKSRGEKGRVTVSFIIGKDGKVSGEKVERGVSPLLDAEALRVMRLMPDWKPGTQNGVPVNVRYLVPITFRLTGGKISDKYDVNYRNNDKEIKEKTEFPGGEEALTTYLLQKVNESPVIRNCKLKGNAEIFFYIDEAGKVIGSRIKTASNKNGTSDPEVTKALADIFLGMPTWKPAKSEKGDERVEYALLKRFRFMGDGSVTISNYPPPPPPPVSTATKKSGSLPPPPPPPVKNIL